MSECNIALNASINQKEQPNVLYAHGSVIVYTAETEVEIKKAVPPGYNPAILLLNLTITPKPGPKKGTARAFLYEEAGDHVNQYTHVKVVSNQGDDCTVEIEVLG